MAKIRSGFVSNSSSSSFIIAGIKVDDRDLILNMIKEKYPVYSDYKYADEDYDNWDDYAEDISFSELAEILDSEDLDVQSDYENDVAYIGKNILSFGYEAQCSLDSIRKSLNEAEALFGKDVKIYAATTSS